MSDGLGSVSQQTYHRYRANAVVDGHAHVTQDVEQYGGTPIINSLRRFAFDSFEDIAHNADCLVNVERGHERTCAWRIELTRIDGEGTSRPAPKLGGT